ncbi:hypothetical protein HanXRQr2_Chr13g0593541 [Helianthus annuus]|uniref:Uncharacterized protein n=1 Tax=Helianthus annuus TaxID=4232 RepID=A0A9K3EIJ3_HELAN|nr:hypothetical protein HanXRQr2_Chr13g0593541 [Helianthus annuus]KAJ0849675.1 hypothetical protein HanPSC8_Chr13g0571571 [Helianthus annuus]
MDETQETLRTSAFPSTHVKNLMGRSGAVTRGFLTTMPVAESHKKKKKLSTLTQEVNLHHFMMGNIKYVLCLTMFLIWFKPNLF